MCEEKKSDLYPEVYVHPDFTGFYKHVKAEGVEEYVKADGANFLLRKMVAWTNLANPDMEIQQDGDKFNMKVKYCMFTQDMNFTMGNEFEEKLCGDEKEMMRMLPSWEGDKLVIEAIPKVKGKGNPCTHTRYLDGDEMVWTMQIGDVKATHWFKRQAEEKTVKK